MFSVISLLTAVGSCCVIFDGVIGSLDSYSVKGSLPAALFSLPAALFSVPAALFSSVASSVPVTESLAVARVSLNF
jgi:hypothetical protein